MLLSPKSCIDKDLDVSKAGTGIWLVKIPKYIASRWEKAPGGMDVGKLKVSKIPGQKTHVSMTLSEDVMCLCEPGEEKIPKNHRLDVTSINKQTLGVFTHFTPEENCDSVITESENLSMEGQICQKLECRPYDDNCYMKLKLESIKKASQPTRKIKHLDRIVHNYKPVSNHKHNIEYEERKKSEGKKARDDKDVVLEMLFAAFEKHQYYNIKDLVKKTRQPVIYLKEILKEVCNYNLKNPHKNMWELKPEYRHYKEYEPGDADDDDDGGGNFSL